MEGSSSGEYTVQGIRLETNRDRVNEEASSGMEEIVSDDQPKCQKMVM